MNRYVGEYKDDTVEYIKEHLKELDEQISHYTTDERYIELLKAKSTALIALSNACLGKEMD